MLDEASLTPPDATDDLAQFVVFSLDGAEFGLDARQIVRVTSPPALTRIPRVPACVEGVANVRGVIVPVISLRKRLGLPPIPPPPPSTGGQEGGGPRLRLLVADVGGQWVGLIVDDVIGLQTLPGSAIEPAAPGEAEAGCTAGIARCAGRSFVVLDLVRLVAAHSSTSPEAPSFREGEMASG